MVDSTGKVLSETAHNYIEYSNKGICNCGKGECVYLPRYKRGVCKRASYLRSTLLSGNIKELGDIF